MTGGAILFVVTLVVLFLVSSLLGGWVRNSRLNALDRSLGMVTGLVLGAVVVCFGFVVMARLMELPNNPANRPDWIRTAKSTPIVEWGANQLISLLPREWRDKEVSRAPGRDNSARQTQKTAERLAVPKARGAAAKTKSGYSNTERREMDRLMRTQR